MPNTLPALIIAAITVLLGRIVVDLARRRRAARARIAQSFAFDHEPSGSARSILAETSTPEGTRVVLFEDTWHLHVIPAHGELEPHLQDVLDTIVAPDHREDDDWPDRERFFKLDVGPSRWLMVVVSSEQEPLRIVTALGYKHGRSPRGWTP